MTDLISREAAKQIATNREIHAKGETAWACRGIAVAIDLLPAETKPLMICKGCGCTMTDEEVIACRAAGRFLSCCPERNMQVATREDWDHWMKVSDEIEKDLREAATLKSRAQAPAVKARPLEEWHEDMGDCVWWCWEDGQWLGEPAMIGNPLDSAWPGYHTHFTPHPDFPPNIEPAAQVGEACK